VLSTTTMRNRTDLHDIASHLFTTKKKMWLLIQQIIFNFFGCYLVRILAEVIYPDGGYSYDSTSLQVSVKILRKKKVMKLSVKVFPNHHSLLLSYASNARYSLKFRQQIWIIYNSIMRGEILYGVPANILLFVFFFLARQPTVGQVLLIHEVTRSHATTHHIR
jgi:hypothetical protein